MRRLATGLSADNTQGPNIEDSRFQKILEFVLQLYVLVHYGTLVGSLHCLIKHRIDLTSLIAEMVD